MVTAASMPPKARRGLQMKTKLGISAELFGAALYFTGLISIIPLVLMAGYAFIVEDNDWLKKTAVKAVGVVIFFTILSSVVGLVGNSATLLNDIASLFRGTTFGSVDQNIMRLSG
jgi:hypothetical protein